MKRWRVDDDVETARVVSALVETAWPIILERYRPDCCIVASLVAVEALEFFGVEAAPAPVRVMIASPRLAEALAAGDERARGDGSRWPFRWYAIGVGFSDDGESGFRTDGSGYVGHVVAEVPSIGLFVDLSIAQASRPERGIALEPKAFARFWPASPGGEYEINGSHLIYETFDDRSFERAKDYRLRNRRRPTTGAVIRAIKARLLETTEVDADGNSDGPI